MKSLLLTILMSFILMPQMFAQEGKIERADKKFNQYSYVDARKIYLDVAEKGYESADIFQKIADSYYFNGLYGEAASWYEKLVEQYPDDATAEYYFRYAQSLRALKNYALSDEMMNTFKTLSEDDTRSDLFEKDPNYLTSISYKKSKYQIAEIRSINSRYSDFAPTEYEGRLIFASSRDTGGLSRNIHKWNNQPFLDLYIARLKDGEAEVDDIKQFSKELNSKFHESTTTFSPDGRTVYFTRNNYNQRNYRKSKNGTNKLKIYRSRKKNGSWGIPTEMPFNSDEYSTAHPTLNADGTKLYFASDMPGTIGLSDIWVVAVDSTDNIGEPRNLGRPINTEGRETFPFSSQKGNLYFASDGHPGLGGLDVFVTTPSDDDMTSDDIENLGETLNSSFDDFSFIVNDSTNVGYFASNRKRGLGSDDIYRFVKEELPTCDIIVQGTVTDQETGKVIPEAVVLILNEDQEIINSITADEAGAYSTPLECEKQYIVRATKEEYGPAEVLVETPNESGTLTRDLELKREVKLIEVGDDLTKVLELNPIYFDLDRFNIRRDAALELEKVLSVMREYPNMVIDVRSHTDSRASSSYNNTLSNKRAKATIEYLITQGIDRNRLSGKGYGESQLVNRCADGVSCSEVEHQANRRSEFIVISND